MKVPWWGTSFGGSCGRFPSWSAAHQAGERREWHPRRAKRKEIHREVTQRILDECWCIAIAEQPRVWGLLPSVKNFAHTLDDNPLWHEVWLDKEEGGPGRRHRRTVSIRGGERVR